METKISDLPLAAYLVTIGHPLLRVEGDGRRKAFVFGPVPDADVYSFYQGSTRVDARKVLGAYRDLKGLVVQALAL
jgi:hypothetical protein